MVENNDVVATLTGRGLVSAEGCEPARVRYRMDVVRHEGALRAAGTLRGSHATLRPVWLVPDARLRLKDGRSLGIAVTDLIGDAAEFESTGAVPEHWAKSTG